MRTCLFGWRWLRGVSAMMSIPFRRKVSPARRTPTASCAAGRFLVTQDLDFSDIWKFAPATHPGLMLVRLRQPGARSVAQRIEAAFANEGPETWVRCFTVLSDRKIRVRRPRTGA